MFAFKTFSWRVGATALGVGLAGVILGAHFSAFSADPTTAALSSADHRGEFRRPSDIPFPKNNPYTAEKARLGRMLFFDTRLSVSDAIACASCHNPSLSWGDGRPKGIGHGMKPLGRRSPTILNAAWIDIFMWDGRFPNLEAQALGPIQTPAEMNMPIEEMLKKLKAIEGYKPLFDAAFPGEGITPETVAKAIATYERVATVAPRSSFDSWVDGQDSAISDSAKRGFAVFTGKANCMACHDGWNFTDNGFHDIGLASEDIGRGKQMPTVVAMQHAFKTPGLRDVARRGPFMHDGSLKTLGEVIDHYATGGLKRPSLSSDVKPFVLSPAEKADLIAFLESLTARMEDTAALPDLPR